MDFNEAEEGKTRFLVPLQDQAHPFPPRSAPVFFNPRMEISRDATVVLASLLRPDHYLDAMGATGARGLRIANECGIGVTINDRDPVAVEVIRHNAAFTGLPVRVSCLDVNALLSSSRFAAVDLDPFGTPAPFIDSAIRGSERYLFITATDTAPLCGAHRRAGMRRYFATPINNEYHAETGLRVLLGAVVREAVKYVRGVVPLFCFAREHFIRLHLRLVPGAGAADRSLSRVGYVMQCPVCPFRAEQEGIAPVPSRCPACGSALQPNGPLWTGEIQDTSLLARMEGAMPGMVLGKKKDLQSLVAACSLELPLSWHYDYHALAKYFRTSPPPLEQVLDSLRSAGYAASRAHYSGTALKTDAPLSCLGEIFKKNR